MQTRQIIESDFDMQKSQETSLEAALCGASNAHDRKNMNSVEGDLGLQGRIVEDWKIERLERKNLSPTQVTSSMSSYKPQIPSEKSSGLAIVLALETFWGHLQDTLQAKMSGPTFTTWIAPCRFVSVDETTIKLAVPSDFSRVIIHQRYREVITQAAEALLGWPVALRLVVDKSLDSASPAPSALKVENKPTPQASQTVKREYPLAKFQNPTNNPEVALLLEKYGDIRGVMKNHPFFKRIQKPVEEGGWGTDLGGLIYFAKEYTLERVLWAAKAAKDYQGAENRGSIFTHAIKKGLEAR
jgi:hypothetical protein